jgi:hypothetical protein
MVTELLTTDGTSNKVVAHCCRAGVALNDVVLTTASAPQPAVLSLSRDGAEGVTRQFPNLAASLGGTFRFEADIMETIRRDLATVEERRVGTLRQFEDPTWVIVYMANMWNGVIVNWCHLGTGPNQSLGSLAARALLEHPGLPDVMQGLQACCLKTPSAHKINALKLMQFNEALDDAIQASLRANQPVQYPLERFRWVEDKEQVRAILWGEWGQGGRGV